MTTHPSFASRSCIAAAFALILTACGGGGGGGGEGPPPPPPVSEIGLPYRNWILEPLGILDEEQAAVGQGGGANPVDETRVIGGLNFAPEDRDGLADVAAFSSESGRTYWVDAEAPTGDINNLNGSTFGGKARLYQSHRFRKDTTASTLRLLISEATVDTMDFNGADISPPVCPWIPEGTVDHPTCFDQVSGKVSISVLVDSARHWDIYAGTAQIRGYTGEWSWHVGYVGAFDDFANDDSEKWEWYGQARSIFRYSDFLITSDVLQPADDSAEVHAELAHPVALNIDLSEIGEKEEFEVFIGVTAIAHNRRAGEAYAGARFRDPITAGGPVLEASGLTELAGPTEFPAEFDVPLPECAVPSGMPYPGEGGTVAFQEPSYLMPDSGLPHDTVFIGRTNGTQGVQIVQVQAEDDTALAGIHYEPVSETIVFYDGDDSLRAIPVRPIRDHAASGNHALGLKLTAEPNCGRIGSQDTTQVTLIDVDFLPAGGGTGGGNRVGGVVSGLIGSGLRLEERNNFISVAINGNGPFEFNYNYPLNTPYDVRVATQPTNPLQVCTVTNATGVNSTGFVRDILVECVAPAPVSGLDPTFGTGGRAIGPAGIIRAIARQDDGKIVAATSNSLMRYLADGSLDTTFGTAGTIVSPFGSGLTGEVFDVAVQSDGRIVVAGTARPSGSSSLAADFAAARFNADGTSDSGFNGGATVLTDFIGAPDRASRVLLQPDGSVVLAGFATTVYTSSNDDADFALVRLHTDGSLDTGFGTNGRATADFAQLDFGYAAALQPDGSIVVGGRISDNRADSSDVGLARFTGKGALDAAFGQSGTVRFALSTNWDEVVDLALQLDGRIVAAVAAKNVASAGQFEFGVLRLNTDGSRDVSFGVDGWVATSIGPGADTPRAVAVQADGNIVVAGSASTLTTGDYSDFGFVRYLPDGTPDVAFGSDGKLVVNFFGSRDEAADLLIQPDGKIVAAGSAQEGGASTRAALARILP